MLLKAHPLRDATLRQITQHFGEHPEWYARFSYDGVALRGHNGLDFGVPSGTTIQSVDDGAVLESAYDPTGFGYYVRLQHTWGESLYAHLGRPGNHPPAVSQAVRAGDVVGLSDNSGFTTGPHLHFGIRVNPFRRNDGWGGFTDPESYLKELDLGAAEPAIEQLREAAWNILGIPYGAQAPLTRYARANNLGVPLTKVFTLGGYQCQGFALGIVYAPAAQPEQVKHVAW